MRLLPELCEPREGVSLTKGGRVPKAEPQTSVFDLDAEVHVGPGMEDGMDLEDLGQGLEIAALEAHRPMQSLRRKPGDPRPLLTRDLGNRFGPHLLRDREQEGASQEVALHTELQSHRHQRPVGEVLELELRIEGSSVVGPATRLHHLLRGAEHELGDARDAHPLHIGMRLEASLRR